MKTKFGLKIDDEIYDVTGCVQNWDSIVCSLKRDNFSGVSRSFTSKFEFVGDAGEMLLNLYSRSGFLSEAKIIVSTQENDWSFIDRFECPLDFSSISWKRGVVSIGCLDNGLAAKIKANKGTKYEMLLGEDILSEKSLMYDRVELLNTVSYEIEGDETAENGDIIFEAAEDFTRMPTYVLNDGDTYTGSPILTSDESKDSGACIFETIRNAKEVVIKTEIEADIVAGLEVHLFEFDKENPDFDSQSYTDLGVLFDFSGEQAENRTYLGHYTDIETLKSTYPTPPAYCWTLVGGTKTEVTQDELIAAGSECYYAADGADGNRYWEKGRFGFYFGPGFNLVWYCITHKVCKNIVLRNRPSGKKYALFYKTSVSKNVTNNALRLRFCSKINIQWKSRANTINIVAVTPLNLLRAIVGKLTDNNYTPQVSISDYDPRIAKTYLFAGESLRDIPGAKMYSSFDDFCGWMETVFGYIYQINRTSEGEEIRFLHRDELFCDDANIVAIHNVREVEFSTNAQLLYSEVEIGYEKQDYENECGRDEWNFTNRYTTGLKPTERKLTLQSRYRADCYGFELLAQQRTKETKDNESDTSIFFVYCTEVNTIARGDEDVETGASHLEIDRSVPIIGAITDTIFNAIYSPYHCLKANESYIAVMGLSVPLRFASSDGNSEIVIEGHKMSDDVTLDQRTLTALELSFETDIVEESWGENTIIEVEDDGIRYSGYLSEVEMRHAKEEVYKYKLIVKSIELC